MNRKIKFRIWNDYDKKMIRWNELLEKNLANIFTIPSYNKWLMQYTGLNDKNGKEIYEGDIVRIFKGDICVVEYNYNGFGLKVIDESKNYGYVDFIDYRIEVIGNIYDNPELLGGE